MKWLSFLFLSFALASAHAEVMSLGQVVRQGLSFSPEVQQAEAKWREAQAATRQNEGQLFPQIKAVGKSNFKHDPTRLSNQGLASTNSEEYDAALNLTQPLYRGGGLINGIAKLKLNEEIYRQRWIGAKQKNIKDLVQAFYQSARSQHKLAIIEEHINLLKAYSAIVNRYETIGRARRMDRLQAAVNLSLSQASRADLERDQKKSFEGLKRLLGLQDKPDAPKLVEDETISAAGPISGKQAVDSFLANNPELKASEYERERIEYENALERVEDRPSLNLVGNWGFRSPDRPTWFKEESRYYTVGLVLEVPLFSGLSSLSKRRVHAEKIVQGERTLETKRLDLQKEVESTVAALKNEFERLTTALTAVKEGREALRLADAAYRQGTASPQDVLSAQKTRYDSEVLLIDSQYAYLQDLADLRMLMGLDLEKIYAK